MLNNLDSNTIINQAYFDAWRGHHQQNPKALILRHYVYEDENESSVNRINFRNFTEKENDIQFSIRRGSVLSVFGMNRKEIAAKLEEYEK